jgi:uncharacterized protein YggE
MSKRNEAGRTVPPLGPGGHGMSQSHGVDDGSTVLTITGTGGAAQGARLITVQAGVETFGMTAAEAMRDNSEVMADLRSELSRLGIDSRDVRTVRLTLQPGYRPPEGRVRGFNVSHLLTIVFRDIEKSGAVLDALVNAGSNQIQGPNFSWEPTDEALDTARLAAIRDAGQRAEFFADALGLKIKRIVTMREAGISASGQPQAAARMAAGTEISAGGDGVVRASVYAEYELVK